MRENAELDPNRVERTTEVVSPPLINASHHPSALAGAVPNCVPKATHLHWCASISGSYQHKHLTHLVPAPGMGHLKYESSSSQRKSFPKINYFTLDFMLKMLIIIVLSV